MAIWPVCPGFVYQFNKTNNVAEGWINLYKLGWLFAVFMGGTTYVVLSYVFKDTAMFEAQRHPWESYAENQQELLDKEPTENSICSSENSTAGDKGVKQSAGVLDKELTA
jgi:hypothetical protein